MTKKMKLFISDARKRKASFIKRKNSLIKKLNELVTNNDCEACAVIYNPDTSITEAWPSKKGVEEMASKFMELSLEDQAKNMVDEETFLRQMIAKEEAELQKIRNKNRDFQIREIMWGCVEGRIDVRQLGEKDLKDLGSCINNYLNQLTHRIETLTEKEDGDISSVDSSPHQPETDCLATITTTSADACAPIVTKKP